MWSPTGFVEAMNDFSVGRCFQLSLIEIQPPLGLVFELFESAKETVVLLRVGLQSEAALVWSRGQIVVRDCLGEEHFA